jgi:hypothetical protein
MSSRSTHRFSLRHWDARCRASHSSRRFAYLNDVYRSLGSISRSLSTTSLVYEDNTWKHRFLQEESKSFLVITSEEFVELWYVSPTAYHFVRRPKNKTLHTRILVGEDSA